MIRTADAADRDVGPIETGIQHYQHYTTGTAVADEIDSIYAQLMASTRQQAILEASRPAGPAWR